MSSATVFVDCLESKKSFDPRHDLSHKLYTPKLIEYILDINPDLIISTFPLAAACVYNFKEKYNNINIPSLTVITDVVDSLEWVYPNTDMYFVPSCEIKNRFVQKGIHPDKIKVTGVPISNIFNVKSKEIGEEKMKSYYIIDTFFYKNNVIQCLQNNYKRGTRL